MNRTTRMILIQINIKGMILIQKKNEWKKVQNIYTLELM